MLQYHRPEWVAAVAFSQTENYVDAAQLLPPASQSSLGAKATELFGAEAQSLVSPDGRREAAHLGDADSVSDVAHSQGLKPGPASRALAQTFCLHLRASCTTRGVSNTKVFGHRRHLRGLALGLFLESSFNRWAGGDPRRLFERDLKPLLSKGPEKRPGHPEPFGSNLLRV